MQDNDLKDFQIGLQQISNFLSRVFINCFFFQRNLKVEDKVH